jgi:hypothetical protein
MSSIESLEQKIDLLTKQILLLASNVDRKAKVAEDSFTQANQSLTYTTKSLNSASQDFQSISAQTMNSVLKSPMQEFKDSAKDVKNDLVSASNYVSKQVDQATQKLDRIILFAIAAFTLAGIVCLGAFLYAYSYLDQKIDKTEWISDINAAVASGKLTTCSNGGACVNIDKKLIRLGK